MKINYGQVAVVAAAMILTSLSIFAVVRVELLLAGYGRNSHNHDGCYVLARKVLFEIKKLKEGGDE